MASKNKNQSSASAIYMSDPDVFCEFINLTYFSGRKVIRPERVQEMDRKYEIILDNSESLEKTRDVIKHCTFNDEETAVFSIFGIENQADIDYAMPVRILTYDILFYNRYLRNIQNKHEKEKDLNGSGYAGKFSKTDRLPAVHTACLYTGKKKWDGARSVRELIQENFPELEKYLPDYRIKIECPSDFDDEVLLNTETSLGRVFGFIKHSRDKDALEGFLNKLKAKGRQMMGKKETDMINACTNAGLKPLKEGDEQDVCEAFEQNRMEGLIQGRQEMFVQTCQEFNCSYEEILERFINKFHTSASETKQIVDQYWIFH